MSAREASRVFSVIPVELSLGRKKENEEEVKRADQNKFDRLTIFDITYCIFSRLNVGNTIFSISNVQTQKVILTLGLLFEAQVVRVFVGVKLFCLQI